MVLFNPKLKRHITSNKTFDNPQYDDALQSSSSSGNRRVTERSNIAASLAAARHASAHGRTVGAPGIQNVGAVNSTPRTGSAAINSSAANSANYACAGVSYEPAGTTSANNSQLYAIPMAATDGNSNGSSSVGAGATIYLRRVAVGTVVAGSTSGAYEIVTSTNGLYAPGGSHSII